MLFSWSSSTEIASPSLQYIDYVFVSSGSGVFCSPLFCSWCFNEHISPTSRGHFFPPQEGICWRHQICNLPRMPEFWEGSKRSVGDFEASKGSLNGVRITGTCPGIFDKLSCPSRQQPPGLPTSSLYAVVNSQVCQEPPCSSSSCVARLVQSPNQPSVWTEAKENSHRRQMLRSAGVNLLC